MAKKTSKKILVVEDDDPLRLVFSRELRDAGYEIIEAADGERGLAIALAEHPDLILLDIIMPVMDGLKMLSLLRDDDWGKDVPVMILTNLSDKSKIDRAKEMGAKDYLVKVDWEIKSVLKKLEESFNK